MASDKGFLSHPNWLGVAGIAGILAIVAAVVIAIVAGATQSNDKRHAPTRSATPHVSSSVAKPKSTTASPPTTSSPASLGLALLSFNDMPAGTIAADRQTGAEVICKDQILPDGAYSGYAAGVAFQLHAGSLSGTGVFLHEYITGFASPRAAAGRFSEITGTLDKCLGQSWTDSGGHQVTLEDGAPLEVGDRTRSYAWLSSGPGQGPVGDFLVETVESEDALIQRGRFLVLVFGYKMTESGGGYRSDPTTARSTVKQWAPIAVRKVDTSGVR